MKALFLRLKVFYCLIFFSGYIPGAGSQCSDWNNSSPECQIYLDNLKADTAQDICGKEIYGISGKTFHTEQLLRISFCLKNISPFKKIPAYVDSLKSRLINGPEQMRGRLKTYRIHQEFESALALAHLAALCYPENREILSELYEIYRLNSEFHLTGMTLLAELRYGFKNETMARFELDNLVNSAQIEIPPGIFLKSLIESFSEHNANTLKVLEEVCWIHNNYEGVFFSRLRKQKMQKIPWQETHTAIKKFLNAGLYDYSEILLAGSSWQKYSAANHKEAIQLFFEVNYQLKQWENICEYSSTAKDLDELSWKNKYYLASAYAGNMSGKEESLKSNRNKSRELTLELIKKAPSPWNYKAVLLRAEILIKEGRFDAADKILKEEKNNNSRMESSGPILYWSAVTQLFSGNFHKADSLLVLASSYTGEEFSTRSILMRYWIALDTSIGNRELFFNGLSESPLPYEEKIASINKIPSDSPLKVHGKLESVKIHWHRREPELSLKILNTVENTQTDAFTASQIKVLKAFFLENKRNLLKSLALYDEILLKFQQGVIAEFSRERIRNIKSQLSKR